MLHYDQVEGIQSRTNLFSFCCFPYIFFPYLFPLYEYYSSWMFCIKKYRTTFDKKKLFSMVWHEAILWGGSPCGSNDRLQTIRANLFLVLEPRSFSWIFVKFIKILWFEIPNSYKTVFPVVNLRANFLFVCSAKLSFDYVDGLCGNPSNFNICFMF